VNVKVHKTEIIKNYTYEFAWGLFFVKSFIHLWLRTMHTILLYYFFLSCNFICCGLQILLARCIRLKGGFSRWVISDTKCCEIKVSKKSRECHFSLYQNWFE
jgi:hypothetical protein